MNNTIDPIDYTEQDDFQVVLPKEVKMTHEELIAAMDELMGDDEEE